MILCYVFLLVFLITFSILIYKYKNNNKIYLEKIELLRHKIIEINKKQKDLKLKSYYNLFKIVRHIYTHFKPETITLYIYNYKKELKITTLKFLYQIKSSGNEPDIIFTGDHNNVPITNIDVVTKSYFNHNVYTMTNIDELNKYDSGLSDSLKKDGINRLYLVNIYNLDVCINREKTCRKNKPIAFFSLTYKDKILSENEIELLTKETEKLSEHLVNIIS
jgi:hypothetical protein